MWMTKLKTTIVAAADHRGHRSRAGSFAYRATRRMRRKKAAGKTDKDKLQGTWIVAFHEVGGQKLEADDDHMGKVVVKGDAMTPDDGQTSRWTVTFQVGRKQETRKRST